MLVQFDYETLEELSKGKGLNQIQNIFNSLISELHSYLKLRPLYKNIFIELTVKEELTIREKVSDLDFGVEKIVQDEDLTILIFYTYKKYLPFILLREAYYCFLPKESSKLIKICVNQIIENDLNSLSISKEWKKLIRSYLVDGDFIHSQFDKLGKFFKIEAKEPLQSASQFFFQEVRENVLLSIDNIESFYDLLFERYADKTSRSLFNKEIIETLRVIIQIFYIKKKYLNLTDYQNMFKQFIRNKKIDSDLSLRKFNENLLWINKFSSIAPSYDISYSNIDLCPVIGIIKFNPLLEKDKIKTILEEWPFYQALKFSENSFATEIFLNFIIPKIYLKNLLEYFNSLEAFGYFIKKDIYLQLNKAALLNLNYFIDISNIKKIIDHKGIKYDEKFEIESIIKYSPASSSTPLSILDFIILDRVRNFSVTGLTFDKRKETLNAFKEDIENELRNQVTISKSFKDSLEMIFNFKPQFLQFLEENLKKGFLYLYIQLNDILNYINKIEKILNKNPEITNIYQLQTFLNKRTDLQNIEDQILIQNEKIKKILYHDFFSLYFQSISLFKQKRKRYQSFYNLLNACYVLKILDLNKVKRIVNDLKLAEEICYTREKKYEAIFKSVSLYKITNEKIESTIESFLNINPPVIKPYLIGTILTSTFAKYYPLLILKNTPETREKLNKLIFKFPRVFIYEISDLIIKQDFIYVLIYLVNIEEKEKFLSFLFTYFKHSTISFKRYFWRGVKRISKHRARDFYDFENKSFYYSEDFFKQLLIYSQKMFGKKLEWPKFSINNNIQELFWAKNQKFDDLVNTVKKRVSYQDIDFDLEELDNLKEFNKNLEKILQYQSKYKDVKSKIFFKRYIRSIKFIPAFQKFGFSQYYLYFRPFNYDEVDFKLLFKNTFQTVKYPACIETSPALFYRYIFPHRNPNKSYLNWLVKSKKNVSEFCLFYKKKIHDILHFNRNLTKEGWNYSSIRFKSYMQNILFNPAYDPKISGIRDFDINEISESNTYTPDTKEFEALTQIYNVSSIDIKSYLGTNFLTIINSIESLLEKKLIFPYLSLKNLDFEEKVLIILPDISQQFNETIIKIFNFFNFSRIYEIEGEFFIYGFEDVKTFENGLLLEIWFPKCELDEFFEIFDLIFQYFKIKHYLILTDLVKGDQLIKSVFGNLKFLEAYNPLKNLIWNTHDKKWINYKLFNEKFEPLYPDLLYGNDK